jgi:hypothetical protein
VHAAAADLEVDPLQGPYATEALGHATATQDWLQAARSQGRDGAPHVLSHGQFADHHRRPAWCGGHRSHDAAALGSNKRLSPIRLGMSVILRGRRGDDKR